ncbi:DUF1203 domain-containing protein [Anderseniella sp. Alg231-50]|uniref:DUF1203 domain-containing protein n=1 Tax=Anderseniella sp. Alg231-50 TaxID=1922226 RepID=UPI000D5582B1
MSFLIQSLEPDQFGSLFSMSDDELQRHQARRVVVDANPGTPCRVSLQDAEIGEEVVLVHYEHQPADSPFRSSHAIYVRNNVAQSFLNEGEIPALFRHRLMSVRAFNADHIMIDAEAVEGTQLESVLNRFLDDPQVDYIHLHYAKPGCFAARVERC